jgi:hypothetical protein
MKQKSMHIKSILSTELSNGKGEEVEEVQSPLNQKLGSKSLITVDFTLRFIIIIESTNFEFRFY